MNDLKTLFGDCSAKLAELETKARGLQNQNLADIAMTAKGRLQQLVDHPDLHLLTDKDGGPGANAKTGEELYKSENQNGNWSTLTPEQRATYDERALAGVKAWQPKPGDVQQGSPPNQFPGSQVGGPDRGKPDTRVPGDPRFDAPNQNFQQPNAVDLNPDGTVRQAPNTLGAHDVRKG